MFTKLKKKIAEEAAITPRPGGAARIPRSVSKESITSAGADSGDDFASDGSSSRDDLPYQISRRNNQIRRLEAKVSATVQKFQEQNEAHQANRVKIAEEHALALEKKDQEWLAKIGSLEEEKNQLCNQTDIMEPSLSSFQKTDLDKFEVFQQQEMSKIKHTLLNKEQLLSQVQEEVKSLRTELVLSRAESQDAQDLLERLKVDLQKVQKENDQLSQQRTELTAAQEGAKMKITELEQRQQELQDFIQNLSLDLQKAQSVGCSSEKRLTEVQEKYEALNLYHEQFKSKVGVEIEEKDLIIMQLQEKSNMLEKNPKGSFSGDGHQEPQKEEELRSSEVASVAIAKSLEETRKEKEDLQQQVANLNAQIEENTQDISQKNEELTRRDKETVNLRRDYDALLLQMQQLHSDLEIYKSREAQREEISGRHASSETQVSPLQDTVTAVHEPLKGTASRESNGGLDVGDVMQLQRENQELEQQITEKNKTIKQLQQRMVELKKTLQKELKLKPEAEIIDVREKPNPDPLATSLTMTSSSDLTDLRELNLEYLKHVVLKFMSAREAEAFHLIKAVSVLLNFSVEEENLLKETLEYKMSWFGSKPVPKGTARPSIFKPRTTWS
ncbi:golgin subfamily A member 1 isoform X2 [Rana temporaria]|uniref:golgin subfamily A member 1 isoform X2 n=1 Tax=Rana temporaria TaxID=8407 RepID=UPI001AADEA31|nr:golgin subfamily A member 1 isoform X2 [Rana temporaria]